MKPLIIERISVKRADFIASNRIVPDHLYIGQTEFESIRDIKDPDLWGINKPLSRCQPWVVLCMEVTVTDDISWIRCDRILKNKGVKKC